MNLGLPSDSESFQLIVVMMILCTATATLGISVHTTPGTYLLNCPMYFSMTKCQRFDALKLKIGTINTSSNKVQQHQHPFILTASWYSTITCLYEYTPLLLYSHPKSLFNKNELSRDFTSIFYSSFHHEFPLHSIWSHYSLLQIVGASRCHKKYPSFLCPTSYKVLSFFGSIQTKVHL